MKEHELPIFLAKVVSENFLQIIKITPENYIGDNPILFRNWGDRRLSLINWKDNQELNDQYFLEFIGTVLLEYKITKAYLQDHNLFDDGIKLYRYTNGGWKPFANLLNSSDAKCFDNILSTLEIIMLKYSNEFKTDNLIKTIISQVEDFLISLYKKFNNQDFAIDYYSVKIDDDTSTHILQKEGKHVLRVNFTTSKFKTNYTISLVI